MTKRETMKLKKRARRAKRRREVYVGDWTWEVTAKGAKALGIPEGFLFGRGPT